MHLLATILALQAVGPAVIREDSVGRTLTSDDITAIARLAPAGERIWLLGSATAGGPGGQ